jgi:hypothetical protein
MTIPCPARRVRSRVSCVVACPLALWACAGAALGQGQRPTSVDVLPGLLKLEGISYAAGTSPDPRQAGAGSAKLVLTIGQFTTTLDGVPIRDLVLDGQNTVTSVVITPAQAIVLDGLAASKLEIPAGVLTYRVAEGLTLEAAKAAVLTLPLRLADGTQVRLKSAGLKFAHGAAQASENVLALERAVLDGVNGPVNITMPGFSVSSPSVDARVSWGGAGGLAVELKATSATVGLGLPGLATAPDLPLEATVANLRLTSRGEVSFDNADLKANVPVAPVQCAGFELRVRGGKVSCVNSVPKFEAVRVDVLFPESVKNAAGNGRASVLDVGVDLSSGLVIDVNKSLSATIGGLKLDCSQMVLDLSTTSATSNTSAPAVIRDRKSWTGAWLKQGTLKVPIGGKDLSVTLGGGGNGLMIEPQGMSGTAKADSGIPKVEMSGFDVTPRLVEVAFLRNQLTRGHIAGAMKVGDGAGKLGDLDADIDFTLGTSSQPGDVAMTLASNSGLDLSDELGLSIKKVRGRLSTADKLLVLSGELTVKDPGVKVQVSNFRVDANGKLYLPEEGVITLDDPATVDVGVLAAEVRRVGFTCAPDGRTIRSVSFTGTARLKSPVEGLSLGGEIDLEHLTIKPPEGPGKPPQVELGGLGVEVSIPELGTVGASLAMSDDLEGFKGTQVLYGDALFNLKPLGNVGLDVTFLLDPKDAAWFVGGDCMLPTGIKVVIPATPTSPPVPLFEIKGFLGGFGFNVAPLNASGGGIGPIKEPEKELCLSRGTVLGQAGLLLADYYGGDRVWWADATLTATFNPLMMDLTARTALLDLEGVTSFPSNDEWKKRDRIARAYINLDLASQPALAMGGDFDMNFPTRQFALVDASGEGRIKLSADEAYIRLGYWWAEKERDRQRAIHITAARALDDYVELSGKMGLVVDLIDKSGEMRLDTKAEFKQIPVGGTMKGRLAVNGIGSDRLSASGELDIRGRADFEIFEAEARGTVDAEYNTRDYRNKLHVKGTLEGKAGPMTGEIKVAETFR